MKRYTKKDFIRLKIWETLDLFAMNIHLCKDGNDLMKIKNLCYEEILRITKLSKIEVKES